MCLHFSYITGKKADLYDYTNPDWAPSQKMGPELPKSCPLPDPQSSKRRYQRARARPEKVKRFKAAKALLDLQKDSIPCTVVLILIVLIQMKTKLKVKQVHMYMKNRTTHQQINNS